eukprot:8808995-Alexandrium_andersonii.AAC.1
MRGKGGSCPPVWSGGWKQAARCTIWMTHGPTLTCPVQRAASRARRTGSWWRGRRRGTMTRASYARTPTTGRTRM